MSGIAYVAVSQIKAPAFLVGKEGFDAVPTLVPPLGFREKVQVGDPCQRVFPGWLPHKGDQYRPLFSGGEASRRQLDPVARLQQQVGGWEAFARLRQQDVFGG